MRYAEVVQRLYALSPRGMRLGLSRMQRAVALRGHPERAVPAVHVAGTNGKGSVVALLASALSSAGYRVGAFTSPHLHSYTERFRIDGEPVGKRQLAARAGELLEWLDAPRRPRLTFFEISTLLAFELFRDAGCDLMLIEVGLGGRLDSTNVLSPQLSIITHIGRDHMDRLGHTLGAIAQEKAGIVKPGVPVVVSARAPTAQRAIARVARERGAPLRLIERDFGVETRPDGQHNVWAGHERRERLRGGLAGAHQADHLATAFAALCELEAQGYRAPEAALRRGVRRVRWPGRLEWLEGRPRLLLDAAHNLDGARSLAGYLDGLPALRGGRSVLVFGAMADKEAARMLAVLRPRFDHVVLTPPPGAPAAPPAALAGPDDHVVLQPRAALRTARSLAGPSGRVVVAGSIFLMAALRALHLGVRPEVPIRL